MNETMFARRLAEAIRFPTISPADPASFDDKPFRALHDYIESAFPRAHATLARETVNDLSLLYTWEGSSPALQPVLLLAHLDVVPVEAATIARWTHPPFSGTVADDHVWGRGALDDKAAVLGILEAVERLVATGFTPARTVYLAFGHDEEVGGSDGAARVAALLAARGIRAQWSLDEGLAVGNGLLPGVRPPVAMVGTAEKGSLTLELVARGPAGHASMPPARTATGALAAAIHAMDGRPMRARLTAPVRGLLEGVAPEMAWLERLALSNLWLCERLVTARMARGERISAAVRTTAATTVLQAGAKDNVVPGEARALVNLRILPGDTVASVTEHIRHVIQDPCITVTALRSAEASPVAPVNAPGFRTIAGAVRQVFPDALVTPGLVVAGTDSKHYRRLTDAAYHFRPLRLDTGDLTRIHGIDERIGIAGHADAINFYARLLEAVA